MAGVGAMTTARRMLIAVPHRGRFTNAAVRAAAVELAELTGGDLDTLRFEDRAYHADLGMWTTRYSIDVPNAAGTTPHVMVGALQESPDTEQDPTPPHGIARPCST